MAKKQASAAGGSEYDDLEKVDFETALAEVEQIVARLEGGQLGLTESLEQYEAGIKQLKRCQTLLDAAEQHVSLLSGFDADGNPVLQPMPQLGSEPAESRQSVPKRSRRRSAPTSSTKKGSLGAPENTGPGRDSVDDFPELF